MTTGNYRSLVVAVAMLALCASAQVASHAPTTAAQSVPQPKPVARVNGAVLTEMDLLRMTYSMFPYARQHNGVPKSMEAEIRKGAMEMIIFEELLYQDAKRRNLTIPPARLAQAEVAFRKQFPDKTTYEQFLALEANGSKAAMREKIRRSLLIEQILRTEVTHKSAVTPVVAKAYYDKNPALFEHAETFSLQTISILPPANATAEVTARAKAQIKDIVRLGRQAKTARDFGLLAEQLSEDDWRMKLGDRGTVEVTKLPPEVVKAARAMKPGEVSDVIQIGTAYVVIRLNAHAPAGKTPYPEIKKQLLSDLQKQKANEVRSALNRKLHQGAKIEVL